MTLTEKQSKKVSQPEQPKKSSTKKVLAIDLGSSLKKGDELTEEQLANLLGAGFTEDRLFGR